MNLNEALLCVECELLHVEPMSCPRCGSRISFPIARTMNRAYGMVHRLQPAVAPASVPARRRRGLALVG